MAQFEQFKQLFDPLCYLLLICFQMFLTAMKFFESDEIGKFDFLVCIRDALGHTRATLNNSACSPFPREGVNRSTLFMVGIKA